MFVVQPAYVKFVSFVYFVLHSLPSFCPSVRLPVFQERPHLPPTQAQAIARSIPPEQYSYTASILRLLRNRPFILLIITYGGWSLFPPRALSDSKNIYYSTWLSESTLLYFLFSIIILLESHKNACGLFISSWTQLADGVQSLFMV